MQQKFVYSPRAKSVRAKHCFRQLLPFIIMRIDHCCYVNIIRIFMCVVNLPIDLRSEIEKKKIGIWCSRHGLNGKEKWTYIQYSRTVGHFLTN